MRYFFSLTLAKPTLTCRVDTATMARCAVASAGSAQRLSTSALRTTVGTVHIASVAVAAKKNLAMAASAVVVPGTDRHRRENADERWIYTDPSATLERLCEGTVRGMASAVTVKSRLTLCLSLRPDGLTEFLSLCHPLKYTYLSSSKHSAHLNAHNTVITGWLHQLTIRGK